MQKEDDYFCLSEIAEFSSRNILLRDGQIIEDKVNLQIGSAQQALEALPKEND
ncbi:MAG: hypothetical protein ACLU4N_17340 [Butyricimonas faecihominis]